MIKLEINPESWKELIKKGYGLDIVFLLKMIEDGVDVQEMCSTPKTASLLQTIWRKELATEEKLTIEGTELLAFISTKSSVKLAKKKTKNEPFDLWWAEYPPSDTFTYKGKSFKGTRALRVKKEDCRVKIASILNSGEYTIEELVEALKLEKEQKAENSYKTGQNKMSYFQNSGTYLFQNTYDSYVELVRQGHKAKESKEESNSSANETYI